MHTRECAAHSGCDHIESSWRENERERKRKKERGRKRGVKVRKHRERGKERERKRNTKYIILLQRAFVSGLFNLEGLLYNGFYGAFVCIGLPYARVCVCVYASKRDSPRRKCRVIKYLLFQERESGRAGIRREYSRGCG